MTDFDETNKLIIESLKEKSSVKQDVYQLTLQHFGELKRTLQDLALYLHSQTREYDERIRINYIDKGEFEAQFEIGGDILIFNMHTNVFQFDNDHPLWKSSYLKEDASRGYCGIIHVFNFLSDSFKYNRDNDLGYLVARIFVNRENHFLVQGKRQLGFLYNDFINAQLTPDLVKAVAQSIILYTIDFDLFTPPYDLVKEVSVMEMKELSENMQLKTGKRLGFKFQADSDEF